MYNPQFAFPRPPTFPSDRRRRCKENQSSQTGRHEAKECAGKDGFHSVPLFFEEIGDGVESVLTVRWQPHSLPSRPTHRIPSSLIKPNQAKRTSWEGANPVITARANSIIPTTADGAYLRFAPTVLATQSGASPKPCAALHNASAFLPRFVCSSALVLPAAHNHLQCWKMGKLR